MKPHDQATLFSHKSDNWGTPPDLFEKLNAEFNFTIDGAASDISHLCPRWWGPGSPIAEDALTTNWAGERIFLNPPYSMCKQFVKKAWDETVWLLNEKRYICQVVALLPSRTDTKWFHDYVWNAHHNRPHLGNAVRFIKGRLKFVDPLADVQNSAPFPSMIVIFGAS